MVRPIKRQLPQIRSRTGERAERRERERGRSRMQGTTSERKRRKIEGE